MKKLLISIILILCLLVTVVACDNGDDGNKEDVEKNVNSVVDAINDNLNLGDLFESSAGQGSANVEVSPEDIIAAVKAVQYSGNASVNLLGEIHGVDFAMKDGVLFVEADGISTWSFFEDDLKIVTVSGTMGMYEGTVITDLAEYLSMLGAGAEGGVEAEENPFADFTLPQMSADDVEHKDGKYYVKKAYADKVINAIVDEIIDLSSEGMTDTDKNAMKAAFMEYVNAVTFDLYFHVSQEAITGFGFSASIGSDLAETLDMDVDSMNISFDYNSGDMTASLTATENGNTTSFSFSLDTTVNGEGEITAIDIDMTAKYPTNIGEYNAEKGYVSLRGTTEITLDAKLDLTKLSTDGELFTGKFDVYVGNYKAYVMEGESYEYVLDEALTESYKERKTEATIEANIVSENGGKNYSGSITGDSYDSEGGVDSNAKFTVTFSISDSAADFPEIPAAVEEAREVAIQEYEHGFDYDYDEEW